jgi:uncharacterized protein
MATGSYFSLQKEDWSLHRKGQQDQERHKQKVKQAITDNLADLVSDESIVMSDGKQIVKIPIRSLEEYRIRYNFQKGKHGGTGQGDTQVGDVIASDPAESKAPGKGQGAGAGEEAGTDYYEAEVAFEEVQQQLFSELELPNLTKKSPLQVTSPSIEFTDVRRKGLMGNIDKKRTLLESIRRNQMESSQKSKILPDDLRFKTWEEVRRPDSNAVVLAMMDTSGSLHML